MRLCSVPSACITYISGLPSRSVWNAMRRPSGDHTGLLPDSVVRRVVPAPPGCITQISETFPSKKHENAKERPSGDTVYRPSVTATGRHRRLVPSASPAHISRNGRDAKVKDRPSGDTRVLPFDGPGQSPRGFQSGLFRRPLRCMSSNRWYFQTGKQGSGHQATRKDQRCRPQGCPAVSSSCSRSPSRGFPSRIRMRGTGYRGTKTWRRHSDDGRYLGWGYGI